MSSNINDLLAALGGHEPPEAPRKPLHVITIPDQFVPRLLQCIDDQEQREQTPGPKDPFLDSFLCMRYWTALFEFRPDLRYHRLRLDLGNTCGSIKIEVLSHRPIVIPPEVLVFEPGKPMMSALRAVALDRDITPRMRGYRCNKLVAEHTGLPSGSFIAHPFTDLFMVHKSEATIALLDRALDDACDISLGSLN